MTAKTTEEMIGARIRAVRERKGWSLARVGLLAGLTRQGVYRIETGEVGAPPSTLQRIADALGVRLSVLMPRKPDKVA